MFQAILFRTGASDEALRPSEVGNTVDHRTTAANAVDAVFQARRCWAFEVEPLEVDGSMVKFVERIPCKVPFCRRTWKYEFEVVEIDGRAYRTETEWLCAKHWPKVPREMRRRHSETKRVLKRRRTLEAREHEQEAWNECVTAAIEAAAGIG